MLSKESIARSFGQAVNSYDSVAMLQRQMGERLLTLSPPGPCSRVVDLGCGTGQFTLSLQQHFQPDQLLGVDLAERMVHYARKRNAADCINWCCADAEHLPLKNNGCSLIFSNLALQWCNDLPKVFAEAYRVLKEGGVFLFSTLGPATLHELRSSWSKVDSYVHVNSFVERTQLQSLADAAGFSGQSDVERIVMQYEEVLDLARALKRLGASNRNPGRAMGLTGKTSVARMLRFYEDYRDGTGMLPATYEAYYFVLRKIG